MSILDSFITKARTLKKSVVFPEIWDNRILEASASISKQSIARPILPGNPEEIQKNISASGISPGDVDIIDTKNPQIIEELSKIYQKQRPNIPEKVAMHLVKKPLVFAGLLVASGRADAMVAGAASTTAEVIQAASLTVGYQQGIKNPSSFFIMEMPDSRIFFYADCAVNISPDSNTLADIAVSTARSYRKMMDSEPLVAFLSFSSKGSASHPDVDKVIKAVEIARSKDPDTAYDGEFQLDTAISESVAQKKLKEPSRVAGRANVLIFPDLDAGNIAYKITQYLAGAKAYGPILQGFAKPVSDLSRGAKPSDIVGVATITCLLS
ncbi:MAG TPA: phosphate acetyltransferase [bacterium]|nr:phosphate acetyltransferase [bacterium]